MTYKIATYLNGSLEIEDEMEVTAGSAIEALRIFASDRGFSLEKNSFDYEDNGRYVMTESDGTQLTLIEA